MVELVFDIIIILAQDNKPLHTKPYNAVLVACDTVHFSEKQLKASPTDNMEHRTHSEQVDIHQGLKLIIDRPRPQRTSK